MIVYLLLSFLLWLAVFAVGKVGFMLYNSGESAFGAGDVADVLWHGLSMDMTTATYLIVLPWLACFCAALCQRCMKRAQRSAAFVADLQRTLRLVVSVYLVVAGIIVALIICGDAFLYEFWKIKLNAIVFSYMDDVQGTTNSVSAAFLLTRLAAVVAVAALVVWLHLRLLRLILTGSASGSTVQRRSAAPLKPTWRPAVVLLLLAPLMVLTIRGGIGTGTQNVGTAYYSPTLFFNHSAVNPAFSLLSSIKRADDFGSQFRYFSDEAELAQEMNSLYPAASAADSTQPELLRSDAGKVPNILLVIMEGFGSRFVEALGGVPEVAPCINRLVDEGIFFDNYYSNSFRTDRGTASLLSGYVSYPTTSLMRLPDKLSHVPCLARSLSRAGYSTHFLYGGDINFSGTRGYLVSGGYTDIVSDKDFPIAEARSGKWGACDGVTTERALSMVRDLSSPSLVLRKGRGRSQPWFLTYQTLSSHEPFEVPYARLKDPRLNAFAYTDSCVGRLIEGLKKSDAWQNTLVILVPDHGFPYNLTYDDPEFYHCPMLWLGGAISRPQRISVLMNQSDLCATLLGQLHLSATDYEWSRNVLSAAYKEPFVYCTSPTSVMLRDTTGTTVYDIGLERVVSQSPAPSDARLRRLKALLQHTYSRLDALR